MLVGSINIKTFVVMDQAFIHGVEQGLADFLVKDHIVNSFGSTGHIFSVMITSLCHCSIKAEIDDM